MAAADVADWRTPNVQFAPSFTFYVNITPMNRHPNIELHAAHATARAGSRSPWPRDGMAVRIGGFAVLK